MLEYAEDLYSFLLPPVVSRKPIKSEYYAALHHLACMRHKHPWVPFSLERTPNFLVGRLR